MRASPVVQGLRIRLPIQGTQVRSLVQEDPTCLGAVNSCSTCTKPELSSPWAATTEPLARRLRSAAGGASRVRSPRTAAREPQPEKARSREHPARSQIKEIFKKSVCGKVKSFIRKCKWIYLWLQCREILLSNKYKSLTHKEERLISSPTENSHKKTLIQQKTH